MNKIFAFLLLITAVVLISCNPDVQFGTNDNVPKIAEKMLGMTPQEALSYMQKNVFLSLGDGKNWQGFLVEADDIDDEDAAQEFTSAKKRDKFEEAFAAMECPLAEESGFDEFDDDATRAYQSQWIGDASLMTKDMDGAAIGMFTASLQTPETPEP